MADDDYADAVRLVDRNVLLALLTHVYGDDLGVYDGYNPPTFATIEDGHGESDRSVASTYSIQGGASCLRFG